ncbi:hypothetical protein [Methylomonas fluvii]|uniref:Uncharacterized protein n=1 Tax=Methylomonas fluvii TaxID=1854564 RepID=A0ABR9D979_9GAMM|nr:hypothetical protein [Methylomonas fluvii]MBD9359672.1 hypothetical protein [Methylomonas fluvii]
MINNGSYKQFDRSTLTDNELVGFRIGVDKELARRGINFIVGEFGEKIAIEFFNSTPKLPNLMAAATDEKNIDALSRDGDQYSIKTQMKAKKSSTIYPDAEHPDKQLFEYLLLVKLSTDYELINLFRFSWGHLFRPVHGISG